MHLSFQIDADIRKAFTLPSHFYVDSLVFERTKETIFARTWQWVAGPELSEDLTPVTVLPGFLDDPLLLVKGEDVRCLSNVCTHRGKILVEDACKGNLIRCGYHGRRFSLDGKFLSMPEFEDVVDFPSKDDDLTQVPLSEWNGFYFASLSPFAALDAMLANVPDQAAGFNHGELKLTAAKNYRVNAHWALYCENYLEGFHIPFVHKSLNEVVDYGTYTTDLYRFASVQTAYDVAGSVAARYLFIFPNLMFNFYPWGISVNVVRPVTPSQTVVEFLTYVANEETIDEGAGADLHGVEMEDEAVVESVQKGIRSRFYSHGRYSPTREQGTHHFHRLIAEFLNDGSN